MRSGVTVRGTRSPDIDAARCRELEMRSSQAGKTETPTRGRSSITRSQSTCLHLASGDGRHGAEASVLVDVRAVAVGQMARVDGPRLGLDGHRLRRRLGARRCGHAEDDLEGEAPPRQQPAGAGLEGVRIGLAGLGQGPVGLGLVPGDEVSNREVHEGAELAGTESQAGLQLPRWHPGSCRGGGDGGPAWPTWRRRCDDGAGGRGSSRPSYASFSLHPRWPEHHPTRLSLWGDAIKGGSRRSDREGPLCRRRAMESSTRGTRPSDRESSDLRA